MRVHVKRPSNHLNHITPCQVTARNGCCACSDKKNDSIEGDVKEVGWYQDNEDAQTPNAKQNIPKPRNEAFTLLRTPLVSPQCTKPSPGFTPKRHTTHPSTPHMLSPSPQLLILRHSLRRRTITRRCTTTRRTLTSIPIHRHSRTTLLRLTPIGKMRQFRPILDVLPEIADVASDFLAWLEAEGDNGDEAECKPFPALHYAAGVVAAVLALEREVFGAGEAGGEC